MNKVLDQQQIDRIKAEYNKYKTMFDDLNKSKNNDIQVYTYAQGRLHECEKIMLILNIPFR